MYTSRTWPSYFFSTWRIEASARRQNGHWKSEYSTIVTAALSAPRCGCAPAAPLSCELDELGVFELPAAESELSLAEGTRTQLSWACVGIAASANIAAPMIDVTRSVSTFRNEIPPRCHYHMGGGKGSQGSDKNG